MIAERSTRPGNQEIDVGYNMWLDQPFRPEPPRGTEANDEWHDQREECQSEEVERWLETAPPLEILKVWDAVAGGSDESVELADILLHAAFGQPINSAKTIAIRKMLPYLADRYDIWDDAVQYQRQPK